MKGFLSEVNLLQKHVNLRFLLLEVTILISRGRLVKGCTIDSSYLHSVRSLSRPCKGASSVPNAGERRTEVLDFCTGSRDPQVVKFHP